MFGRVLVTVGTAGYVAALYAAIVVAGGAAIHSAPPNLPLAVLATAVVAVSLEPVRLALRRRIVTTDQDLLVQFEETLAAAGAVDQVAPRMAQLLAEATGARRTEVWLARHGVSGRQELAARWPAESEPMDPAQPGVRVDDVLQDGELMGRLLRDEGDAGRISPVEGRLVHDLVGQAGVALRTVALTIELRQRISESIRRSAELRASRQRIVAAADSARHRLERDVHDGAQQHLVALAVNLSLAASVTGRNPHRAADLIRDLRPAAAAALVTLQDLSRGIYPQLLADSGLAAAFRNAVATSPIPVTILDETTRRFRMQVEAAAYFTCLEAVQNAVKHAAARGVVVRLRQTDDQLDVSIEDDGSGFVTQALPAGSGLGNMRDRVESLGGRLFLQSTAGGGTTVSAQIPLS